MRQLLRTVCWFSHEAAYDSWSPELVQAGWMSIMMWQFVVQLHTITDFDIPWMPKQASLSMLAAGHGAEQQAMPS